MGSALGDKRDSLARITLLADSITYRVLRGPVPRIDTVLVGVPRNSRLGDVWMLLVIDRLGAPVTRIAPSEHWPTTNRITVPCAPRWNRRGVMPSTTEEAA